jgi:hypothetical protein
LYTRHGGAIYAITSPSALYYNNSSLKSSANCEESKEKEKEEVKIIPSFVEPFNYLLFIKVKNCTFDSCYSYFKGDCNSCQKLSLLSSSLYLPSSGGCIFIYNVSASVMKCNFSSSFSRGRGGSIYFVRKPKNSILYYPTFFTGRREKGRLGKELAIYIFSG